jgi:hypothetical protein
VACLVFRRVSAGNGISADAVNRRKLSFTTGWLVRIGVGIYGQFFRQKSVALRVYAPQAEPRPAARGAASTTCAENCRPASPSS